MSTAASRDLRNHTAALLRRVAAGDRVTITVNGAPVAELGPPRTAKRASLSAAEVVEILGRSPADPALRDDLAALGAETTDDLGPIR